jgi:hypothetical protein
MSTNVRMSRPPQPDFVLVRRHLEIKRRVEYHVALLKWERQSWRGSVRSVLKYPDDRTSTTLVKNFGFHHALFVPYFNSMTLCLALLIIYRG